MVERATLRSLFVLYKESLTFRYLVNMLSPSTLPYGKNIKDYSPFLALIFSHVFIELVKKHLTSLNFVNNTDFLSHVSMQVAGFYVNFFRYTNILYI